LSELLVHLPPNTFFRLDLASIDVGTNAAAAARCNHSPNPSMLRPPLPRLGTSSSQNMGSWEVNLLDSPACQVLTSLLSFIEFEFVQRHWLFRGCDARYQWAGLLLKSLDESRNIQPGFVGSRIISLVLLRGDHRDEHGYEWQQSGNSLPLLPYRFNRSLIMLRTDSPFFEIVDI